MSETKRPLKVFLCHASADKPKVRELYRTLKRRGVQPWLDAENLIPGQNWEVEIPKALLSSDAIIICLSPNSVDKEGYVQKEIKFALDKALEMPEGRIFLIPARLEDCELPFSLRQYQAVNLYEREGYTKLMKALKLRASQLERNTVELPKEREIAPEIKQVVEEKKSVGPKQETKTLESSHEPSFQDVYVGGNKNNLSQQAIPALVKPEEKRLEVPKAKVEKPEPKKTRPTRKWNTAIVVALIGLVGTIIAALLGSPIIEKWFSPVPVSTESATATITITSQPVFPSKTIEPSQAPTQSVTLAPTSLPTEITDAKGVQMMLVPAGEFTMGTNINNQYTRPDQRPAHQVSLNSYYIDRYEVTNVLYKTCVDLDVCLPPKTSETDANYYNNSDHLNYPVVFVDWYMANTYCNWRNARLPTEAEWAKAAQGSDSNLGSQIIYTMRKTGSGYVQPNTETVSYDISIYGVYDMALNVSEWVSSLYKPYPYSATDGRENLEDSGRRVSRGNNFSTLINTLNFIASDLRFSYLPTQTGVYVGFRCARSIP